MIPLVQLAGKLKQPRQTVWPLERRAPLTVHIGHLSGDVRRSEGAAERGTGRLREAGIGVQTGESGQQPVSVDGRMPIEAPIEGRRQLSRRLDVLVAVEHVRDLVRVLLMDTTERQVGEAGRNGDVERLYGDGRAIEAEQGEDGARPHDDRGRPHHVGVYRRPVNAATVADGIRPPASGVD